MSRTRRRRIAAAVLVAAMAAACDGTAVGGPGRSGEDTAATELPFVGDVPEPSGPVVLTITTAESTVEWDRATLAMLEQETIEIDEPFLDERRSFSGPLWADVVRASGIDPLTTPELELQALDDFVVSLTTDPATLDGVVLATQTDGQQIEVADGGPLRIVFGDDAQDRENLDLWIWSVRSAVVP